MMENKRGRETENKEENRDVRERETENKEEDRDVRERENQAVRRKKKEEE